MLKISNAIVAAAAIAAVLTVLSSGNAPLDAGPLAGQEATTLKTCTQRPWPYLNCVGTEVGNPAVRLVTTEKLAR